MMIMMHMSVIFKSICCTNCYETRQYQRDERISRCPTSR